MANLFDKAKKNTAAKKVEKHEIVQIPELESDVLSLAKLKIDMAALEAKAAIHDANIRQSAKQAMINSYCKAGKFPGTLKIVAGKGSFQFITTDRYKKIDLDRYEELVEEYGQDLVEEETKYSFNTKILEKHMDHISKLIMGSKVLSDSEKEELLIGETSYTVKKGTINNIPSISKNIEDVIEDIQPVFQIKNVAKDE